MNVALHKGIWGDNIKVWLDSDDDETLLTAAELICDLGWEHRFSLY